MLAVNVTSTKTDKPIKKGLRNRSILLVLRMKKVKRPANSPITTPSQGKGLKYHQKAKPPAKTPSITAFFLELTAGLIFTSSGSYSQKYGRYGKPRIDS